MGGRTRRGASLTLVRKGGGGQFGSTETHRFDRSGCRWQASSGVGTQGSRSAERAVSSGWTAGAAGIQPVSQGREARSWRVGERSERWVVVTEGSLVDSKDWDAYTLPGWASCPEGDATPRSVRCGGYGSWNGVNLQNAVPAPAGRPGRRRTPLKVAHGTSAPPAGPGAAGQVTPDRTERG